LSEIINIAGRAVGTGEPVWVIAEAGVNHNGDVNLAIELVHAAKESGADCVKFQTFRAEDLVSRSSPKAQYQLETTDPGQSQFDMLKSLELKMNDFARLKEECDKIGICFLSTPYNVGDVDLLESIGTPAYKIASAMSVEPHLLRRVAKTGKPMLVSTGMCTLDEVQASVAVMRQAGNDQILLFQCTTDYPARLEDSNLLAMRTIAETTGAIVGYSDHSEGFTASVAAIALGACAIERHFTLDRGMSGPDHQASSDPNQFQQLVQAIREVEVAMGSNLKQPSTRELANKSAMRRSIVAARPLTKGKLLIESDIAFKRPLAGLPPEDYQALLGRRLGRDVQEDQPLSWDMIE
jgi:N,N'-diacetyllegionaminate synthase